jgi:type I restriction enzyme R subunit
MATPEQKARQLIDAQLRAAGWVIQDRDEMNLGAGLGVAVREYPLAAGPCDYLLFVDRRACGVLEAKPEGKTLSGVAEQATGYQDRVPSHLANWGDPLRFDYEASGSETLFSDRADPEQRSRYVFNVHRPETLLEWLKSDSSLRARLTEMPPLVIDGLRDCQIEAITALETSLAQAKPRALVEMTMGSGKTFTAATLSYRLLSHAGARRVLFLVDRNNLGRQTLKEFQAYRPPGTGRLFTELYNVQRLGPAGLDPDAKVVISTIQRVYAQLSGQDLSEEDEEASAYEGEAEGAPEKVIYSQALPPETFDVVVIDECHRSIYGRWRQVLEYFDAFQIGLTATPSMHTMGYFQKNLVAQYPYERSVIDKVNVPFEVFRIRTEIGERGSKVPAGFTVPKRDRHTRRQRYEELTDDFIYGPKELDRSVIAPNQIRTVLETYRETLFTELFPGRTEVPKTLIFAKDDHHAEEIVHIAREVFGKGNDFAKKITYRVTGVSPEELIAAFRNQYNPRIAVTVDMIATGTDIKPVEVLIFLRDVKSALYFEQMKGRGVRTINDADLVNVTPDARTKDRFVLIDAVGVSESAKTIAPPLEREPKLGFDKLLEQVASGRSDPDVVTTLAVRLAALDRKLNDEDRARIIEATGGRDLHDIASTLMDSVDNDRIAEAAERDAPPPVNDAKFDETAAKMRAEALRVLADGPALRKHCAT